MVRVNVQNGGVHGNQVPVLDPENTIVDGMSYRGIGISMRSGYSWLLTEDFAQDRDSLLWMPPIWRQVVVIA